MHGLSGSLLILILSLLLPHAALHARLRKTLERKITTWGFYNLKLTL